MVDSDTVEGRNGTQCKRQPSETVIVCAQFPGSAYPGDSRLSGVYPFLIFHLYQTVSDSVKDFLVRTRVRGLIYRTCASIVIGAR
jgi:hypothetical protein